MSSTFGGRWGVRQATRPIHRDKEKGPQPGTEALERRILFATRVWDGGSDIDSNWATAANWVDDVAPVQGDELLFPGGAARTTNTNNFADGTVFNTITFAGSGYSAGGNRITLQGNVTTTHPTGATALNTPLTLNGPLVLTATYAGTTLSLGGAIDNAGHTLNAGGTGTVQLSGVVSGSGGISKNGPGTLSLSGNNTYGGRTNVEAGFLAITGFGTPLGSTSGGTTVAAGATLSTSGIVNIAEPLGISGFGVGGDVPGNTNAALTVGGFCTWTGSINLNADASIGTVFTGNLTVNTGSVILGGHTLAVNSDGSAIFNAPIVGGLGAGGNLVVNRARTGGTVSLNAANTYGGDTQVLGGTLVLGDAAGPTLSASGSLATDMIKVGQGGTFRIDNGTNAFNPNRIPDDTDIILTGGTLDYRGSSAADSSETVDMIVLDRGHSTIKSTDGSGTGGNFKAAFNASSLTRSPGATVDFAGANLGTATNSVRFTTAPATIGNGGGILPYATVNQNDFATYDATLGVRPFANYAPSIAAAGPGDTVRLAAGESVPANKAINALLLTAAGPAMTSVTLDPGVTLTLAAGALVSAGSGSAAVAPSAPGVVSTLAFGREGIITRNNAFAGGDLTVAAEMTGQNGLTLSGPAGLVLAPPAPLGNRYTGGTTINSGQVTIEANNNPFGGTAGGTLDLYGGSLGIDVFVGNVTIPNSVRLDDATFTFHGIPDLTLSGNVTIARTSTLAPPGGFDLTVTGKISGTGALIVRGGSPGGGTLTLSNTANDYSGGTLLVNNGIFRPTLVLGSDTVLGPGTLTLYQGTLQAARPVIIRNPVRLDNADVAFGGANAVSLPSAITLNGINTISSTVEVGINGLVGSGGLTFAGPNTLILIDVNQSGAMAVTGGTLVLLASQPVSQPFSPTAVTGNGTLGGVRAGPIATADQGTVNPGHPPTTRGILMGGGANFSNGGRLLVQVSSFAEAGIGYDRLDLGHLGTLMVGGNSTLTIDLAGVSAPGAAGVIRFGARLGTVPRFSQVNVINNPNGFTVETDYTAGGLNLLIGGAPPDRTAPVVTSAAYEPAGADRLVFTFSESVFNTLRPDDLSVRNLDTGEVLPASAFLLSYFTTDNTAYFTSSAPTQRLAPGNYSATLVAAGVSDIAGNPLAADQTVQFFSLVGDFNRDRRVDGSDFAILAANFGKTGITYAGGDITGEGAVNGTDFAIFAGNFGKTVPQPPAVAGAVAAPPPTATAAPPPATAPQRTAKPARRVVPVAKPTKSTRRRLASRAR